MPEPTLLSDPFLQLPTETSVRVVWFTEFAGSQHTVTYGQDLDQIAIATTTQLSRTREDSFSKGATLDPDQDIERSPIQRPIWRHEAEVSGLLPGMRVPYRVSSVREDGKTASSDRFTLAPQPAPGTPLNILLTSDHQLKPMVPANLQKVVETIAQVDAVFFVGDLVNVPDRASEWFDTERGNAFFPSLQGRAQYQLTKQGISTVYTGGQLLQHAPLFTALGNHEVMGRFSMDSSLSAQFNDAFPRKIAEQLYSQNSERCNPTDDPQVRQDWLKNNSFNIDTYEEMFTLPQSLSGGKQYYATTFGDVRLVVLYVTRVWRSFNSTNNVKSSYQESEQDLPDPTRWGYGQHILGAIAKGTPQYLWLEQELNSPAFQQAKYKVVMVHHPPHTLGENGVPPYTDPVQVIEHHADGSLKAVRYEYPKPADQITRDLVPLLESAGVQLVFYGHSHLWNRFISSRGTHYLESSNVGNSYGAWIEEKKRPVPADDVNSVAAGDPNGLEPVVPAIAPLMAPDGKPLPYIASNDLTVFSILNTGTGTVSSYYFDTRKPDSEVVKFDQFNLG